MRCLRCGNKINILLKIYFKPSNQFTCNACGSELKIIRRLVPYNVVMGIIMLLGYFMISHYNYDKYDTFIYTTHILILGLILFIVDYLFKYLGKVVLVDKSMDDELKKMQMKVEEKKIQRGLFYGTLAMILAALASLSDWRGYVFVIIALIFLLAVFLNQKK